MREFMTKVSDYISERRNDPEKNGGVLIFCMLGIVALIIIIFCLLLLWRKSTNEKTNEKEEEIKAETYAYIPEAILSEASEEEELKQEYLNNMQYLGERVEELLGSMTEIQKSLEESVITQQEDNLYLQDQVNEITEDVRSMIVQLQNTQNHLYDVTDMINVMSRETVPAIQEQISEMEKQMNQVNADVSDIYGKIDALEITDAELKAKISDMEGRLKASVEQNMSDVTNLFNTMNVQMETAIKQMQELSSEFLRYQYDEAENTLYLYSGE